MKPYLIRAEIRAGKERDLLEIIEKEPEKNSLAFFLKYARVTKETGGKVVASLTYTTPTYEIFEKQLEGLRGYFDAIKFEPLKGLSFLKGEKLIDYLKRFTIPD